jgi:hypothetical protein
MFDLDSGAAVLLDEVDLDLGGIAAVRPDVPQVGDPARRLPDGDLTPFDLQPRSRALEDASALAALENHLQARLRSHRVGDRPPARSPGRPDCEGMVGRALHLESHAQRLDQPVSSGRVFSAMIRNRAATSPQTSAR